MSEHHYILIATFAYFAVGGLFAVSMATLSYGFSGKGDKLIPLIFFFWPVMLVLRIPYMPFILAGLAAASLITWLMSLFLKWIIP